MKRFFYDGYGFMRIWFFALLLVLFVVALCAGIVGVTILADRHDCKVYSRVTGYPTRYEFGTCYTFVAGEWMTGRPTIIKGIN